MSGCYSQLNTIVKEKFASGVAIINVAELANEIDVSEIDRSELERMYKYLAATIILNQNGYRSFVKGKGVFINVEMIKNEESFDQIINNIADDIAPRQALKSSYEKMKNNLSTSNEMRGQMAVDVSTGQLYEEMTTEELIEYLIANL